MAENQVEIDVVLNAEQAEKGFEKLEEGSKAVGESFGSVGKAVSSLGGEANQALGTVGESLGGVVDGFGELATAAKTGQMSFTALAGPIGIAVVAVMELVQAFREYSSEVDGTNIKVEAYTAAASELTSIIEQLSDAQVQLNKADIQALRIQSQRAQALTEEGQLLNEKGARLRAEIALQQDAIKEIEKKTKSEKTNAVQRIYYESIIAAKRRDIANIETKLAPITQKADKLAVRGAQERLKLTEAVDEKLKESPEFRKKLAEQEAKVLTQARVNELQATKDQVKSQIEIARLGSKQKIRDIKAIEDIGADVRDKAIKGEEKRLQAEITSIEKAAAEKRQAENEKIRQKGLANRARQRAMEIARERQLQSELKQLRTLEIEEMRISGKSALEIAQQRYNDELKAAGENQNKQLIALRRFENQKARIEQQSQSQRQAMEMAQAQQRQAFIESTVLFDTQRIEDQTTRELGLLGLRYQKEFDLAQNSQEQITELQRRYSIERQEIEQKSIDAQIQQVGEFTNQYGAGLAEAAFASLAFGESFSESVGEILVALGRQASVQALMETAKGTAALFLNPTAAGNHFAAAGLFTGAAIAAGAAGKAMGGGGGAASGAAATSPTGTPQTAPTPQREEADTSSMVFNINFGGAVIYDTQRAAEQALADRITTLQNTRRRGAPRRSF